MTAPLIALILLAAVAEWVGHEGLAALVVGARTATHHEAQRVERGHLDGAGAPLDVVCDAFDRHTFNGDVLMVEVCRCGASRRVGSRRWSPRFHVCQRFASRKDS